MGTAGGEEGRDSDGPTPDDVLDTSLFDDDFVTSAPIIEKSAEERIAARRRADEFRRTEAERRSQRRRRGVAHRQRRRLLRRALGIVITLGLVVGGAYWGWVTGDPVPTKATGPNSSRTRASATTSTTPAAERVIGARPYRAVRVDRSYDRTLGDTSVRTLRTTVWFPTGTGPFPVIAFAHGNDGNPAKFQGLFEAWATAGYVVIAPRFPVSADDAGADLATTVADLPEQNLDLEFVTRQALAESDADGQIPPTDRSRLAVAGLSLGGGTALQVSYGGCCPSLDPRLVVALSPVPLETDQTADAAPLLMMHGTSDRTLPYQGSVDYFRSAANQRWLVTLDGAGHAEPYEDAPSPFDQLVIDVTTGYLDQFLLDDDRGIARADAAIAAADGVVVEQGT